MNKIRRSDAHRFIGSVATAAVIVLLPVPASAQYSGQGAPPSGSSLRPGEVLSPANGLARALRTLAQSPRDFSALIIAGRAALDLGDTQTAIGFFGRAEEVRPSDPAPKIGMGAATVVTGDASGALRWFLEAQRLGATSTALGADRGLAQDLLGNQASAQTDYRAALVGREADEARRRLALSLGISGARTDAFAVLQPLLQRRDPAAQRIRAFVLALVGDERGASSAIDQAMPGTGSRMAGFFRLLPTLSAPQKAAAVHLGVFPDPSEIRVAAVSPRIVAAPAVPRQERSIVSPPRATPTAGGSPRRSAAPEPSQRFAGTSFEIRRPTPRPRSTPATAPPPSVVPPSAVATPVDAAPQPDVSTTTTAVATPVPLASRPILPDATAAARVDLAEAAAPAAAEAVSAVPSESATSIVALSGDRLSGIDRLLAQADELPVPPAPRPRFEAPQVETVDADKTEKAAAVKKAAEAKKVAETRKAAETKKAAEAKKIADAKKAADAKAEREATGLAGSNWVQLAGGSNADRMGIEFRRLAAQSATLKKRGGAVTAGKDYFRLLAGPFPSREAAQAFVNQLAKDGVDGFSWTRTPATLKIEKLPSK